MVGAMTQFGTNHPHLVEKKYLVQRSRLFEKMDDFWVRSAIWVTGPAGAGKTTLVLSYLQNRRTPYLRLNWLPDNAKPGASPVLAAGAFSSSGQNERLPRNAAKVFLERLLSGTKGPAVLVLDNVEALDAENPVYGLLTSRWAELTSKFVLILISRTALPPVPAALWQAKHLPVLTWEDLRFTIAETEKLVRTINKTKGGRLSGAAIHAQAQGWVTGILALLMQNQSETVTGDYATGHTPEVLFDYFENEIYRFLPAETRKRIRRVSIYPSITSEQETAITDADGIFEILEDMHRHNLFIEKCAGEPFGYRFHSMFRDFLQHQLKLKYRPQEIIEMKKAAARTLIKSGQLATAFNLYRECHDKNNMIRLIRIFGGHLLRQGDHRLLREWVDTADPVQLRKNPWLLYRLGCCQQQSHPSECYNTFASAFDRFLQENNLKGALLAIRGIFESALSVADTFPELNEWLDRLDHLYIHNTQMAQVDLDAIVVASRLIAAIFVPPDPAGLLKLKNRALRIFESDTKTETKFRVALPLIFNQITAGELKMAEILIEQYCRQATTTAHTHATTYLKASLSWLNGRFGSCRRLVNQFSSMAGDHTHERNLILDGQVVAAMLSEGNIAAAGKILKRYEGVADQVGTWANAFFSILKTWHALLFNAAGQARLHAACATKNARLSSQAYMASVASICEALAHCAAGDTPTASDLIDTTLIVVRQQGALQLKFGALLAKAEIEFERGKEFLGLIALENALAIGRSKAYENTWMWRKSAMIRLCGEALSRDIETPYVKWLIRRRGLYQDSLSMMRLDWPWPVKICTFGALKIILNGKTEINMQGLGKMPAALLKVLVVMGKDGVHEHLIQDHLWPESDAGDARNAFSTTLHRLRKILGGAKAIRVAHGLVHLERNFCLIDAWVAEKYLDQADAAWHKPQGTLEDAIQATHTALTLMDGPFLQGDTVHWLAVKRNRLCDKLLRCLERLGHHYEQGGHFKKAVAVYQQGLQFEPTIEFLYQRLMTCYQQLGQPKAAGRIYQQCRDTLACKLKIEPSDLTKSILKEALPPDSLSENAGSADLVR